MTTSFDHPFGLGSLSLRYYLFRLNLGPFHATKVGWVTSMADWSTTK